MLDFAIEAAKAGARIGLNYFQKTPKISYKADKSPVTIADKTAEKTIRAMIARRFPDHGIIGEEFSAVNPKANYQWVIDPIDGTRDYVRGLPLWATFVGLMESGKTIAAVAFYPATDEMFTAEKGKGTYLNAKRTRVSKVSNLAQSYMSHGQITRFELQGYFDQFVEVAREIGSKRSFGSYSLATLLKGNVDIYMEPGGSIWDFAVPSLLVPEAGGKFTDFAGEFKIDSGNGLMTNGILHDKVLRIFNSA